MRAVLPLLSLVAGCSFQHGQLPGEPRDGDIDSPDGPTSNGGNDARVDAPPDSPPMPMPTLRQKTITIGTVTGTLTDFPLWVSLTDMEIGNRARADGADIHFVMGNTDLDYEIQSWTKASGKLEAWVRVPSMSTGTQIAVRYGDVAQAHAPDAPGTFAGYAAVWHLDDALNNTTIVDARNMRNGTAQGLNAADSVAAQLGRGIYFDDGNEQIRFDNPLTGNTPHTISLWVNQRATTDNDAMVVLGNGMLNRARWFHSRFDADRFAVGFYTNDFVPAASATTGIINDGWVLLHWVYDGGPTKISRIYRNGTMVAGPATHTNGNPNTMGTSGFLGNAPEAFGEKMGLRATLDEVRIINVARNDAWIAAEAANQSNPGAFYTVSAEQIP